MRRKVMGILLCIVMVTSVFRAMMQNDQQPDSNIAIMAEDSITPYKKDGYEYANEESKLKVYFDENSVGDGVKVSVGDHWAVWKWEEMGFIDDAGEIEPISSVTGVEGITKDNMMTYEETYPFTIEVFTVTENKLKHDIILSRLPCINPSLDNAEYLSYIGALKFSDGLSMHVDGVEIKEDFITSSSIRFMDENGIEQFHIPAPYAYEKNNEEERVDCQYEVKYVNGEVMFSILTPYNWLSDAARNFPVVIDPTVVSGYIYSDTIWTLANSPYIVTDDITVVPGVTLTIEPGVVVKFDGPFELVVDGYLNAQGTDTNNIVFTSNAATPAVGDWLGIKFRDTSPDYGSVLDWVTIMYSDKGIELEDSSQSMSHMSITNNNYGVHADTEGISFSIDNSDIYGNTHGIISSQYHIDITVSNCNIFDNEYYGTWSDAHGSLLITNSNIYDNPYGIYSKGASTISNSEIYQNGYGVHVQTGHTTFSNCDIHDNEYGVYVHGVGGYYGSASVFDSDIYDNEYGIYGYRDRGSLTISGSSINNNLYLGISSPGPLTITDSNIINNGGNGIEANKGGSIHNSNIYGNTPYDVKISSSFNLNVDATHNWWGTTDAVQIESNIYDYYDDYYLGKLNYNPILDGPGGSLFDIGMRPTPYISVDTTWTLAGSPYILTSNVVIEVDVTLTIEPGVVVRFDGSYELVVDGYLNAQGTDTNNIVFTSNSATPSVGDWLGIKFRDTSPDYGSVLDWITVMYSDIAIVFEHSSQSMSHMSITNNNYGVHADTEGISFSIDNSDIYGNTHGIISSQYHIDITVSNCNIFDNEYYGTWSDAHGSLLITNSNIYDNPYGIYSKGASTISNSEIYQNGYGVHVQTGHTTFSNCDIHDNEYGVYVHGVGGYYGSASVFDSDIYNNEYGIYGYRDRGSLTISDSSINNNLYLGISSPGPLTITDSSITNNGGNGIEICKESTIHYSDIYGNSPYDVIIVSTFYFIVNATDNWWGTTNDTLIEQKIYDYYDDYNLTIVFYAPKSLVPWTSNNPPVANIDGPYIGEENSPIIFDVSGSYDPDNNVLQYRWDFDNDGIWDTGYSVDPMTTYTWYDDYTGEISVEVYDGELTNTDTANVTINNVAPTMDSIAGPPDNEGVLITFTSFTTDPGSDDLTFIWNWGDGTSTTTTHYNNGLSPDPYPSPWGIYPFTATDSVQHTYGDNGVYNITLTVEDDDGGISAANTSVVINNIAPTITIVISPSGDEGSSLTFEAEATDPGSDDLTFSWEFEYGSTINHTYYNGGVGPDPPQSPFGTYPFSATDTVSYTYGDNYNYTIILKVTDDDGGMTTYTTTITIDNIAPSIVKIIFPPDVDEGSLATFQATAVDPGSDDLTFTWEFEFGPTITNVYYNDGIGLDPYPSPWGNYPFNATDTVNHIYGDNGMYFVRLTITDDDGGTTTYNTTITVNNVAPIVGALTNTTIDEGGKITFSGHATDPGSDDLTFTWNWDYIGLNDTTNTYLNNPPNSDPYPSPEINPRDVIDSASQTYGDNGIFRITLTVTDDDGGTTTVNTTVRVNNVAPTIVNMEAFMYMNFTLRVAGEKWHSVTITFYEDDIEIWNAEVTRQPGSPDDQAATLSGYSINFGSSYRAVVDYLPNDPRVNGNVWGGNPVWVDMEFHDGTTERLHHTFNVKQSYWDSDHWNHIDPWEVDLTGIIYRHNITFKATATDPGSDDLTFVWDFDDGGIAGPNLYYNNGMSPDPYPSPELNPMNVTDTVTYAYSTSGVYTVTLTVMDDDGGIVSTTLVMLIG